MVVERAEIGTMLSVLLCKTLGVVMKEKKKLLVTASTFPRWEDDTEPRFILDYASHMTEKYDVTVLVPAAPEAKDKELMEGVKVVRYHYFPIYKWETLCYPGAIVPRIKEKKIRVLLVPFLFLSLWFHLLIMLPRFDVVHAHWLIPQAIIQSFFNKPYIITGHGGDISSFNKGLMGKLKYRCMRKAKQVVVVSKFKQCELECIYPDISSEIISMGVNTRLFNRENNRIKNYFKQNEKRVILFVGRLAEIKGVNFLIEAMKFIDNAKLVIVGEGPERQKLERLAEEIKIDVTFLGGKTHNELRHIYASSDVLVVPSITDSKGAQEGLPTVIMEGFAARLPVVATRTGGIPNLIINKENGLLVEEKNINELVNAICTLFENESFYNHISDMAYRTSLDNDYHIVAEKYDMLIQKKCFK